MWRDKLLNMLHRDYRGDPWLGVLYQAAGGSLDQLEADLQALHENRYFDGLTWALPIWERALGLIPRSGQTLDERRAAVRSKWLMSRKADRGLLQELCDTLSPGSITVGFADGYITMTVNREDGLIKWSAIAVAIDEAKPAHLPILQSIPVNTTLYLGGALIPSPVTTQLPQYLPTYDAVPAYSGGVMCSATTLRLPPMEVTT